MAKRAPLLHAPTGNELYLPRKRPMAQVIPANVLGTTPNVEGTDTLAIQNPDGTVTTVMLEAIKLPQDIIACVKERDTYREELKDEILVKQAELDRLRRRLARLPYVKKRKFIVAEEAVQVTPQASANAAGSAS